MHNVVPSVLALMLMNFCMSSGGPKLPTGCWFSSPDWQDKIPWRKWEHNDCPTPIIIAEGPLSIALISEDHPEVARWPWDHNVLVVEDDVLFFFGFPDFSEPKLKCKWKELHIPEPRSVSGPCLAYWLFKECKQRNRSGAKWSGRYGNYWIATQSGNQRSELMVHVCKTSVVLVKFPGESRTRPGPARQMSQNQPRVDSLQVSSEDSQSWRA